ncbi:hypothetical protein FGD67_15585 [Colwellia sp. M166]|jgi:hypothetical protein|nr:hypothetical protein FGD67_15585 [Colwellia sp. M166]|tara:strand:- start:379 stop:576 length:198 start_codon:yes stop_codon:yes gene_type:complete
MTMGFSRKEVYFWLETASDEQLQHMLNTSKDMLSMLTDKEQVSSLKWLRAKIIEEINARREAKQA